MLTVILKIVVPYVLMFIAAYSATWFIWHGKIQKPSNTSKAKKTRKKEKMGVMDTILIIELIAILIYVIVDFWVFYRIGAEPSTLTMGFFAVCGGENGFMAWIKTRKEQERMRKWQLESEDKAKDFKYDSTL